MGGRPTLQPLERPNVQTSNPPVRMSWIQTFSGRAFEPMDPSIDQIDIEDIAHALAMVCRFNGHCRRFYSVAEHSVWVSRCVPEQDALWGLLHDAAEAYVSDVARPIKPFIGGFKEIETGIQQTVCRKYGLANRMPTSVADADVRMLATERLQLMNAAPRAWPEVAGVEPYDLRLACWEPGQAKTAFLERFAALI